MPKKYRVELSIVEDETNSQLDTDSHTETYENDAQALREFQVKAKAVRETGKGTRDS